MMVYSSTPSWFRFVVTMRRHNTEHLEFRGPAHQVVDIVVIIIGIPACHARAWDAVPDQSIIGFTWYNTTVSALCISKNKAKFYCSAPSFLLL